MYYKLKNNFKLRGWKLLPTGVIDGRNGSFQFLPVDVYKTLRLCNGILAEDSPIFSPQQKKYLAELEEAGLIEKIENPSSLESDQEYKFYDNRFLQSVHWSITGNCNCRCKHCYMSAPHAKMGEISSAQCMNIIEQLSECGVQRIIISGGEALVRKDFFEIVDKLLEKKICISAVMSNGLLVNEKLLDEFERRGIYPEFNMSFDGVGGWHDWLRGIKGAEKAVLHAFKICAERGFPTGTEYCLHKGNIEVLRESVKLLGSLGVGSFKVNPLFPSGEGEFIKDKAMTIEEVYETLIDYIPHYYEDGAPLDIHLTGFFSAYDANTYQISCCKLPESVSSDNLCLCAHARNVMYITADARMMPCIPMAYTNIVEKFPSFNETTLKEVLTDSIYLEFINRKVKDYLAHRPECNVCKYRNRCAGGCRGQAISNALLDNKDGDIWSRDPYRCTFFKKGYYDKVLALMENLNIRRMGN